MARHLSEIDAVGALRRGKAIEQLLGFEAVDGRRSVRWVTVSPGRRGSLTLRVHHVFDEGDEDFVDVTEFSPVDRDEYIGEGRDHAMLDTPEDALHAAATELHADPHRWVNQGVVEDEYRDHR